MFVLKKLFSPFLLPPGLFILILAVFSFKTFHPKNRKTGFLLTSLALFIWLVASGPFANMLMRSLESDLTLPVGPKPDVIIMLGGDVYSKSQDLSGIGAPGNGTMERLVTAARLYRRTGAPILISGGRVFSTQGSIALIAARFLMDLGIPSEKIMIEDRSRDTYENALYSAEICRQWGFTHPLMLTSGYHIKRSMICFAAVGLKVTPYPCALQTWPDQELHWTAYLPTSGALSATAMALHEWLGIAYYKLRY